MLPPSQDLVAEAATHCRKPHVNELARLCQELLGLYLADAFDEHKALGGHRKWCAGSLRWRQDYQIPSEYCRPLILLCGIPPPEASSRRTRQCQATLVCLRAKTGTIELATPVRRILALNRALESTKPPKVAH